MPTRVRLVDVARQAGVSLACASMALHDPHRGISAATAARVRQAAKDLGYVPDSAARALSSQAAAQRHPFRGTVAYLINNQDLHGRQTLEHQILDLPGTRNLRTLFQELGYTLDGHFLPSTRRGVDRLAQILSHRGTVGLLVDFFNAPFNLDFPWTDYPVVATSQHPLQARFDSVVAHSAHDILTAVRECRKRSYSRIGLAVSTTWFPDWKMGFLYASECHGGTLADQVLVLDGWNSGRFHRWLRKAKPDAVIANEDRKLPDDLEARGIHIPRDLGYCCLHIPPHLAHLSGIRQLNEEADRQSVSLLHSSISAGRRGPSSTPIRIEVTGAWHEGTTLCPAGN